MRLSREASGRINALLDDWVPPRVRDSRAFAALVRRMHVAQDIPIEEFKDRAFQLSSSEFRDFYRTHDTHLDQGDTDLTPASEAGVVAAVVGCSVLDVACGKGHLATRLATEHRVVGCDVSIHEGWRALSHPGLVTVEASVESLPFAAGSFDTVVSTHTLEHVQHLGVALDELRRVARQRVVIVVPRQRPYQVTFNPHIHFFPYRWSLLAWTGTDRPYHLDLVGGDWLYVEHRAGEAVG
ncbi:MAG TPA: class I SAM-dependent methyltransferase [Acidimicrobiales bacterium]|nr:class I SAM-dependent methyltransferase [Acidimicrobiales bacterium]